MGFPFRTFVAHAGQKGLQLAQSEGMYQPKSFEDVEDLQIALALSASEAEASSLQRTMQQVVKRALAIA